MRRTGLSVQIVAAAVLVGGCGGGSASGETKTVTKTVTDAGNAGTRGVGGSGDFCGSGDADNLTQAASEAERAFNDAKVDAMHAATEKALKAAAKAPPGTQCAIDALNSIRDLWNQGGNNFAGSDIHAEARRIRDFQARHQLR